MPNTPTGASAVRVVAPPPPPTPSFCRCCWYLPPFLLISPSTVNQAHASILKMHVVGGGCEAQQHSCGWVCNRASVLRDQGAAAHAFTYTHTQSGSWSVIIHKGFMCVSLSVLQLARISQSHHDSHCTDCVCVRACGTFCCKLHCVTHALMMSVSSGQVFYGTCAI